MVDRIPEILLVGGTIRTISEPATAESMLIRDARIVLVGTEEECRAAARAEPTVIDLAGATVLPGFIDAHCHPLMHGQFNSWADCGWENAPSVDAVVELLTQRRDAGGNRAIRGRGFHHGNVAEQRMLNRHDLDRVATDREVLVFHSSGHGAVVNSWALTAAGVDRDTPDPSGGHFGRDEDGTPNGEVWDAAADWLTGKLGVKITNHGPNFHLAEDAESLVRHLADAQREFHRVGITSVVDAQVTGRELTAYQDLRAQNGMTLRVEMLVISSLLDELEALGLGARLGDDVLAFAGMKLYVDGALTAGTARFEESYCCKPDDFGYLYHDPAQLQDLLMRANRLGMQTGTHAQGDAAIEIVLDAHEAVARAGGRVDARHRIEHYGAPTPRQLERTKQLGLWPVTQPQYVRRYGDELDRALGLRAQRITPLGELQAAGLPLVISSDAPVCPPHPMEAVYSAVTRTTLAGQVLGGQKQNITVEAALRAHTLGAAESIHREKSVGSLEPGKLADFVILAADPVAADVEDILGIETIQTWIGGTVVYSR